VTLVEAKKIAEGVQEDGKRVAQGVQEVSN